MLGIYKICHIINIKQIVQKLKFILERLTVLVLLTSNFFGGNLPGREAARRLEGEQNRAFNESGCWQMSGWSRMHRLNANWFELFLQKKVLGN